MVQWLVASSLCLLQCYDLCQRLPRPSPGSAELTPVLHIHTIHLPHTHGIPALSGFKVTYYKCSPASKSLTSGRWDAISTQQEPSLESGLALCNAILPRAAGGCAPQG